MRKKNESGSVIHMAAPKHDLELNSEEIIAEAFKEIREIRKRRMPSIQSAQLIKQISTPEHLKMMYEAGNIEQKPKNSKKD